MKRLNRKGFTLVELLAVIVILAIVVGITMATILPTLQSAREESFGVALDTIEKYIQDQVELYTLGPTAQGSNYVSDISYFASNCQESAAGSITYCGSRLSETSDILELTEYTSNISEIGWYVDKTGNVQIYCATATGDYEQGDIKSCSDVTLKQVADPVA